MKQSIRLVAALLLAGIGFAEVMFGQGGGASESKFLTIGTVSKIDLKSKSITIKDGTSSNLAGIGATGGDNAARQGRGNRGGGGVAVSGGGSRQGRRDGGGSAPSMPGGPSAPLPTEFKVSVSAKAVIRDGEDQIKIEDLKIGDRLEVYSMKFGSKLDATEIVRMPKDDR